MFQGICNCGAVSASFASDTLQICHCVDCRKFTGAVGAFLLVGKAADMTVTGAPKEWVGKGGTGGSTSRFFCGECGCSVYDTGASEPGKVFVQAGKFGVHNRY